MHDPIQAAAEEIAAWFDEESIKEAAHLMSEQKAVLKLNLESIIRRHLGDREVELLTREAETQRRHDAWRDDVEGRLTEAEAERDRLRAEHGVWLATRDSNKRLSDENAELREALILACNTITDWQTGKGDTGVSNAVLSGLHLTLMRLYERPIHEILGESAALEKTSPKVGK